MTYTLVMMARFTGNDRMKITRKQYLDGGATHREYYGQFVTDREIYNVSRYIGKAKILASTDEHFNDIALKKWDALPNLLSSTHQAFKEAGDWVTLSGMVCVYKEAALQIKEMTG